MKNTVVRALLSAGAVKVNPLEPFLYSSGMYSPVYCDNRALLSHPAQRHAVFVELLQHRLIGGVDGIVGVATAGIPWATMVATTLGLPLYYVRSKAKDHGTACQVEGGLVEGKRLVVIEDLVTTGGSALSAVQALRKEGAEVDAVISLFSYGKASSAFGAADVILVCLAGFEELYSHLKNCKLNTEDELKQLEAWYIDPEAWSDKAIAARVCLNYK